MLSELMDCTKVCAYFLWEYTQHDNPLCHWHCAEDIACLLETRGILSVSTIKDMIRRGRYDYSYVEFVRKISFMIFTYTNNKNSYMNWYAAERLLANSEWLDAIVKIANIYREEKGNLELITKIRADSVRAFYLQYQMEMI